MKRKERDADWHENFIDKTALAKPFVANDRKLIDHIVIGAKLCIEGIGKKVGIFKVEQAGQINDES